MRSAREIAEESGLLKRIEASVQRRGLLIDLLLFVSVLITVALLYLVMAEGETNE